MKLRLLLGIIVLFAVGCNARPIGGATGWTSMENVQFEAQTAE